MEETRRRSRSSDIGSYTNNSLPPTWYEETQNYNTSWANTNWQGSCHLCTSKSSLLSVYVSTVSALLIRLWAIIFLKSVLLEAGRDR